MDIMNEGNKDEDLAAPTGLLDGSNALASLAAAYDDEDDDDDEVSSLSDSIEGMEKFQELDTTTNRTLIRDPIITADTDLLVPDKQVAKIIKDEHELEKLPQESSNSSSSDIKDEGEQANLAAEVQVQAEATKDNESNVDVTRKEILKDNCTANSNEAMEQEDSNSKEPSTTKETIEIVQEKQTPDKETCKNGKHCNEIMEEDDSDCPLKDASTNISLQQEEQNIEIETPNNIPSTPCNSTNSSKASLEENVVQFQGDSYHAHRINDSSSDSSSGEEDFSASNDSGSDSDGSEPKHGDNINLIKKKKGPKPPPKVKGELSVVDLPPIEDLQISVPHEKCQPIGVVQSFVDPLVIVEGYQNSPALNLDSVLFVEQGDRALGHIFDVFGPVKHPHYCVRFNSKDHLDARGIKPGMTVYCAPATPHSKFVFLAQLEKLKGTDASWLDDVEPPTGVQEFSDDEQERAAKKLGKGRKKRGKQLDASVPPNPEQEEQQHRNAAMPRKRNYNYVEGDNSQYPNNRFHHPSFQGQQQHAYSYPQHSSPYVPSYVPGFGPPPPPPPPYGYPPSNLHHFYERGGRRMQQFRPHYDNSFHHRGSWSGFEQPNRHHYWRPPPIQGKPQWAPFTMNDHAPFEPRGYHHNRPRLFPKSAVALASQASARIDNAKVPPNPPPPPGSQNK